MSSVRLELVWANKHAFVLTIVSWNTWARTQCLIVDTAEHVPLSLHNVHPTLLTAVVWMSRVAPILLTCCSCKIWPCAGKSSATYIHTLPGRLFIICVVRTVDRLLWYLSNTIQPDWTANTRVLVMADDRSGQR